MRVFLSGGLGNQLFQWTFAHFLALKTESTVDLVKLNTRVDLDHAKFDASKSIFPCAHLKSGGKNFRLVNEFTNPNRPKFKNLTKLRWGEISDTRNLPFLGPKEVEIVGNSSFVGYFQNSQFVERYQEILLSELRATLEAVHIPKIEKVSVEYQIVHVRQADTAKNGNRQTVGVLSREYYRTLMSKYQDFPTIVVTDDLIGARNVMMGLKFERILSNLELDQLQTLKLFMKAKRVVTANSTFSWWGGFLGQAFGAEVVIPHPFFVSKKLDASNNLHFPGFKLAKANFQA